MIKLLIADDELVVRQGLRQAIDWDKLGICIVGDADNAKDAIRQANQLHPDIILCDIRMPGEDGFSVIKAVRETMPDVQFILISGYDDQEYMLNAIRYGVCDYLLKPLDMVEIRKAVLKVCSQIHARKEKEKEMLEQNRFLIDNLDILRTHFINKLLHGSITSEQLKQNITSLSLSLQGPNYIILLAKSVNEKINELIQNLAFIFRQYTPTISSLQNYGNLVVVILNIVKKPDTQQFDFLSKTFITNLGCLDGIVAVSPLISSPMDFKLHLPGLIDLIERGFWYPKGSFRYTDVENFPAFPKDRVQEMECRLIDSIKNGSPDKELRQQFDELLFILSESRPKLSVFREEMGYLFQKIHGVLGIDNRDSIYNCSSVSEARQQFAELCNLPNISRNKYGGGLVGRILHYIGLHYQEDISLEKVACDMYISYTYLSRILKEKTNKSFIEWLHYFRVEKAKELLAETDYSINKIAEICGYNSYKVLSEHFRNLTGLTASEYRSKNSCLNKVNSG